MGLKIDEVECVKGSNKMQKSGTFISFQSSDNVNGNALLEVNYNDKFHYFNVISRKIISGYEPIMLITAAEIGRASSRFIEDDNFDIRKLIDCEIMVVNDKEKIKKIENESCWL